jgi:hypothetical protein
MNKILRLNLRCLVTHSKISTVKERYDRRANPLFFPPFVLGYYEFVPVFPKYPFYFDCSSICVCTYTHITERPELRRLGNMTNRSRLWHPVFMSLRRFSLLQEDDILLALGLA